MADPRDTGTMRCDNPPGDAELERDEPIGRSDEQTSDMADEEDDAFEDEEDDEDDDADLEDESDETA